MILAMVVIHNGMETYFVNVAYSEAITDEKHLFGNAITDDHLELSGFFDETEYPVIYYAGQPSWDALVALTSGLQEGIKTNDLNGILWASNNTDPVDAIVVTSSTCPDPITIYGDVLLRNEIYTVKKIDTSYPFCLNRQDFSSMSINQDGSYFNGFRKLKKDNFNIEFFVSEKSSRNMELTVVSSTDTTLTITPMDGNSSIYSLQPGPNTICVDNILFSPEEKNLISVEYDNNGIDLYISNLEFDGMKELEKTEFSFPSFEKYKWLSFKYLYTCIENKITHCYVTAK